MDTSPLLHWLFLSDRRKLSEIVYFLLNFFLRREETLTSQLRLQDASAKGRVRGKPALAMVVYTDTLYH